MVPWRRGYKVGGDDVEVNLESRLPGYLAFFVKDLEMVMVKWWYQTYLMILVYSCIRKEHHN